MTSRAAKTFQWFSGLTLSSLTTLLLTYGSNARNIERWSMISLLFIVAAFNSVLAFLDYTISYKLVSKVRVPDRPIFILGHYRSGTTLMQNSLLACCNKLSYVPLFVCFFPNTCFIIKPFRALIDKYLLFNVRDYDAVAKSSSAPFEEDLGLTLQSGKGAYAQFLFPTAINSSEILDSHTVLDTEQLYAFLRRSVAFNMADGIDPNYRLVLKSPPQTSRLLTLSQQYPNACFIYVHRHPYEVFKAMKSMGEKFELRLNLDGTSEEDMIEAIFVQYNIMLDAYLFQREKAMKMGVTLIEFKFEELIYDLPGTITRALSRCDLPIDQALINTYMDSIKLYKRNNYNDLSLNTKKLIYSRWRQAFDVFGYAP